MHYTLHIHYIPKASFNTSLPSFKLQIIHRPTLDSPFSLLPLLPFLPLTSPRHNVVGFNIEGCVLRCKIDTNLIDVQSSLVVSINAKTLLAIFPFKTEWYDMSYQR